MSSFVCAWSQSQLPGGGPLTLTLTLPQLPEVSPGAFINMGRKAGGLEATRHEASNDAGVAAAGPRMSSMHKLVVLTLLWLPSILGFRSALRMSTASKAWPIERIRNFAIIAHIDHGKSTLADRLIEFTKTVQERDMKAQICDTMDLERERGITIKLQAVRMEYKSKSDGETYLLNLIDTPGHVDFAYEVSRSLAACEGGLLVVDASQGVEAQTLANVYLAIDNDLEVVPVLNKIDLPAADPDRVAEEVENTVGIDCTEAVHASAKAGIGIEDILEQIVTKMPPPEPPASENLRALIFDSYYDAYRGVVVFFRVIEGSLKKGDKVRFMASKADYDVSEIGVMTPAQQTVDVLGPGEVGYLCGAIKSVDDARVGDTITLTKVKDEVEQLPGYSEARPMVFCGLYPTDADGYDGLRDALGKLKLNDAALTFEPETSSAMGFGFRCGFLGLLHMDIVQERLEREYDIDLIVTAPSVVYEVEMSNGEVERVDNPSKMPEIKDRNAVREPYCRMELLTPTEYTGTLMELAQDRRGELVDIKYLTPTRSTLIYDIPLAEIITDFFDQVKSRSKGYASMEYSLSEYRENRLERLDIRINGDLAAPLSVISHRDKAHSIGKRLCEKLKNEVPRQQFKVSIQACIGVKPIASSHISPFKKNVIAKCYGGDASRKKKLLQKQAKGKKRMKMMGSVNVPQSAFLAVLDLDSSANRDD